MVKKSDLSIGFWFRVAGTKHNFCVEEVYKEVTVKGERIMLGGNDHICGYEFYYTDELEPIPLTGEILTKNGFVFSDSEPKFSHPYDCGESISLFYDIDSGEWIGEFFGSAGLAVQVQIHYVHELQRNIRGVEIDHDIEL